MLQGAVYHYNGYLFFPIQMPAYWITANASIGRKLEFVRNMTAYFINDIFPIQVRARFFREVRVPRLQVFFRILVLPLCVCHYHFIFPRYAAVQISIATFDGSDPIVNASYGTPNTIGGAAQPGGGYIFIPPVAGLYLLRAISLFVPDMIVSPENTRYVNISIRKCALACLILMVCISVCTCMLRYIDKSFVARWHGH